METMPPLHVVIDQSQFKLRESSLDYIDRRLKKLDVWTRKFPTRDCHIHQERCERTGVHKVAISLHLPRLTLTGRAEEGHLRAAFDHAFKKLLRQLNEFKHLLRREHLQKRSRMLREAAVNHHDEALEQASRDGELARFKEALGRHLETLARFVADDVAQIRRHAPDFQPSQNDLVEAAVLEALETFSRRPRGVDVRSWLYEIALRVVDRRAHQRVMPTRDLRPREVQAGIPRDRVSAWQLFWGLENEYGEGRSVNGRDEDPIDRMGSSPDPARHLEVEEMQEIIDSKLAELPRDWRRAFRLHYLEGFAVPEIGRVLGLSDDQVWFRLRGASEFLREHLEDVR